MNYSKQKTIHTSFDKDNEDLYFTIMRESTRRMVPIAALSRFYIREGMKSTRKPAAVQ